MPLSCLCRGLFPRFWDLSNPPAIQTADIVGRLACLWQASLSVKRTCNCCRKKPSCWPQVIKRDAAAGGDGATQRRPPNKRTHKSAVKESPPIRDKARMSGTPAGVGMCKAAGNRPSLTERCRPISDAAAPPSKGGQLGEADFRLRYRQPRFAIGSRLAAPMLARVVRQSANRGERLPIRT